MLHAGGDELTRQFDKAQSAYTNGRYDNALNRIERIIGIISDKGSDRKEILGKCYLLLGGIYEKQGKALLAEENYRKAIDVFQVKTIDGVDVQTLPLFRQTVQRIQTEKEAEAQKESVTNGTIQKEGKPKAKKKKKFPWLLVAGGVVVVGIIAVLLLKKKKKKYTLTVTIAEGAAGNPAGGSHTYSKGSRVDYDYSAATGFGNVEVLLDGQVVSASGFVEMNSDHTLIVRASANEIQVLNDVDGDYIDINEGDEKVFHLKLSAQPTENVTLKIEEFGGSADITILSGATLTFTPDNYDTFQPVTLKAGVDGNVRNDDYTLRVTSESPGIPVTYLFVREIDGDTLGFVTNYDALSVTEGRTVSLKISLSSSPEAPITVHVTRVEGDKNINIRSGSPLTFNSGNWYQAQDVIIEANEDADTRNSTAVFRISADGMESKAVTVTEIDKDSLNFVTSVDEVPIAEGGTAPFTVRLSAQPSATVNVTVAVTDGDADITVSSGNALTFTASNWNTAQTVTLAAAEDDDIEDGETDIRIHATSTSEIPDKDIVAKEVDNDSFKFETDKATLTVPENGTEVFSVRLTYPPDSDLTATVARFSGDESITVSAGDTLTFTSSNWNTYQQVTLAAADDDDSENGTATIRISAEGISPLNVTAVEADDDFQQFLTDPETLLINEGDTAQLNVRLGVAPTADVIAAVTIVGGDGDWSISEGQTLTFTPDNWETDQPVTVTVASDDDLDSETATIRITANGVTTKNVPATSVDNDSMTFVTDKSNISIDENGTETFTVSLSAAPPEDVTATIAPVDGGDPTLSVQSGGTLTFTTANWSETQTVTLAAADDGDTENGTATVRISSSLADIPQKDLAVAINDDDTLAFGTDLNHVPMNEGETKYLQVHLTAQPTADVTASVSIISGGDPSITIEPATLTFTTENWNDYQSIAITAAQDWDGIDAEATIRVSASGLPDKDVTVFADDTAGIAFDTDVVGGFDTIDEGETKQFNVKLTGAPDKDVNVLVYYSSGDKDIRVTAGGSLTFTPDNWDTYQPVTLTADADEDAANGVAVIAISSDPPAISTIYVTFTETDDDEMNFETDNDALTVPEGSTVGLQVRLTAAPTSNLTVTAQMTPESDIDITIQSGGTLTFTPENWNQYQTVTIAAAEDDGAYNGSGTVSITADGVTEKTVGVTESDND